MRADPAFVALLNFGGVGSATPRRHGVYLCGEYLPVSTKE